jgi:hypothetical protein
MLLIVVPEREKRENVAEGIVDEVIPKLAQLAQF